MTRLRLTERLRLQAAMLTGVIFHDPQQGMEMYDDLTGQLSDENHSDNAWLFNKDARTQDASALEHVLQRRVDERRKTADETRRDDGSDGNTVADADAKPRTRTVGLDPTSQ